MVFLLLFLLLRGAKHRYSVAAIRKSSIPSTPASLVLRPPAPPPSPSVFSKQDSLGLLGPVKCLFLLETAMPPPSAAKFLPTHVVWVANLSVDFTMGHRSLQMGLRFYKIF